MHCEYLTCPWQQARLSSIKGLVFAYCETSLQWFSSSLLEIFCVCHLAGIYQIAACLEGYQGAWVI
jgi:hypothetical protein